MAAAPPALIVLAARESGGSALSALLGAHPAFCAAPHLNALAFEAYWQLVEYARKPRDPNLHGLLRFVAQETTGEQTIQAVKTALRWLHRRRELPAEAFHAALRALAAPRRLVDYSPLHAQNAAVARRVAAAAPDAKILHLTRAPQAQAEALSRSVRQALVTSLEFWPRRGVHPPCIDMWEVGEQYVDWSTTPAVFDPQFAWHRSQAAIVAAMEGLPAARARRLRFEDLQADPEGVLGDLLDWLGAARSPERIAAMLAAEAPVYGRPGPYVAPFGVDFELIGRSVGAILAEGRGAAAMDLGAPLPWRGDGETLLPQVAELAVSLGYEIAA
ncbi:MAG: sulfotransferase [Pseudomonadota bacterium]